MALRQFAYWPIRVIQKIWSRFTPCRTPSKSIQTEVPVSFEIPNWDPVSHKKVRDALVVLGSTIPDWRHAAGSRNEVDPVRHLIVTATGWGLNPDKDAIYLNITPSQK